MQGLLEKLAQLSLKKAGSLSKKAGKYGGATLGAASGPLGSIAGEAAGQAIGGGVKSILDTLAGQGDPRLGTQGQGVGNLQSFRRQPGFGSQLAGNFGNEMGEVAGGALGNLAQHGLEHLMAPDEQEQQAEEKSVASQLEELLDSLTPEERASILAKYAGG